MRATGILKRDGAFAARFIPLKIMNTISPLTGAHLRTYQTIFQHPISHNLQWRDVRALLEKLCRVTEEPNGNLKVIRHGRSLVLPPPRTKDVAGNDELIALRHFLEKSEPLAPPSRECAGKWLLVIDHHEARIFRQEGDGAIMQQILPPNPADFSRGKEQPDPHSFFPPVARALQSAAQILIFGRGTGKSCEMDQFVEWAKIHQPALAGRIVGTLIVDEKQMTKDQLIAKAKEFYATPGSLRP